MRCTEMDCVLMEIFIIRMLKENAQTAAASKIVELAKPMAIRASANDTNPVMIGPRLLNLETSQPESGNPINELMGIHNSCFPNSASLYLKLLLMVGILEAQVEKHTPERKKKTLRKIRCLD